MERKFMEFKGDIDKRTFEGYAAAYGNIDADGDIIERGAFSKSIADDFPAGRIKILWRHNDPIGIPVEMREDDHGLFVVGKISKTALGNDALELMKDKVVDRMSVGFNMPEGSASWDKDGIRHIHHGALKEFSVVPFPANDSAIITAVKELTPREVERVLREAGLTKAQAQKVALRGVAGLREADQDAVEMQEIINLLKNYREKS